MIAGFLTVALMALCALCCLLLHVYQQLVAEIKATECALTNAVASLSGDLTAGLLALRDDAVTRISDIQQVEPRVVRVEVPREHGSVTFAHQPAGSLPTVKLRRSVELIFLDAHEQSEVGRAPVDPLRRARVMTFNGSRYVCVRGSEADGFTYRQED